MHTLAIITVVYKNYSVLQDFFDSLARQTDKKFEIFIADLSENKQKIKDIRLKITVIPGKNLGYAHGVNLGIVAAHKKGLSKYCVINDDTYVKEDFIQNCIDSLAKHPSSIIGGKIYYAPGFEYHKNKYSPDQLGKVLWYAGGKMDWLNVESRHIGVDEADYGQHDKFVTTEFVTGCLMCFDIDVIDKTGMWDESFFLYYEDTDFCLRAKTHGVKLYYNPQITIWHKNSQSTGGSGSGLHQKYQYKNKIRFGLRYAPWRTKFHLLKNTLTEKLTGRKAM